MKHRLFSCAIGLLALAAPSGGAFAEDLDRGRLYLRSATVDVERLPALRSDLPAWFDAKRPYVIKLDGPMTPERRARLEAAGVRTAQYLPVDAFLVDLSEVEPEAIAGLKFVSWIGAYRDEWKFDPSIGRRLIPFQTARRQALEQQGLLKLVLTLAPGAAPVEASDFLSEVDGEVVGTYEVGGETLVDAVLPAEALALLPSQLWVRYIEEAPETTLRSSTVRWIVQSNASGFTPLYSHGLTGQGQVVGILDTPIDSAHCSFYDDVPFGPEHRKILAYNTTPAAWSHGTHVAGIVAGDAGVWDDTRGIAYEGKIVYATKPDYNETAIVDALTLHHDQGARVHTNSWGNDGTTDYDSLARGYDVFCRSHEEDVVLVAITNSSTLKNPENAKNIIAVGASGDTPSQHQWCSGGVGPTSDGRRKPEIFAPGCGIYAARYFRDCDITPKTGTSMACPAVAGVAMLVRQYFMEGYYPTGFSTGADGFTPSGALVKSVLLNSAVDLTAVPDYPSDAEGWGRVLADDALYFDGDVRRLIVLDDVWNDNGLSTGEFTEYPVEVTGAGEQLRFTLVWTEPAAAAGAALATVNDLDLEVVAPDLTLYRGNQFDVATGEAIAGGSADNLNNVEQVHLSSPMLGEWTVRVRGSAVNDAKQGYAVIVTGQVDFGVHPQITQVESIADHDGVPIGLEMESSDVEPRLGGVAELVVGFDLPMDVARAEDPANVDIAGVINPSPAVTVVPTLEPGGMTVTLSLSEPLPDGDCYTFDLSGMTSGGAALDPSAATFTVRALAGDVNRNGAVSTADFSATKPYFGQNADASNVALDLSQDGLISTLDASQIKPRLGGLDSGVSVTAARGSLRIGSQNPRSVAR